jgi:hypothetical protein
MATDKCSPHGWTLDTLEAFISERLVSLEKIGNEREERNKERFAASKETIGVAMIAADKAIVKAEIATEKRFDSVNEFRASLADQAASFLPRTEYSISHKALSDKIDSVMLRITTMESAKDTSSKTEDKFSGRIYGIVAIAISLATLVVLIVRHY